jgi:hypothetical protein
MKRFSNGENEKDVIKRMIGKKPDGFDVKVLNEFCVIVHKEGVHRAMIVGSGTTIEKCIESINEEIQENMNEIQPETADR